MYLSRLSLQNYRNYARLDLDLAPGASIFLGGNAQGKTNLLEAIALLATTRAPRAGSDLELIRWQARETEAPVARVDGRARRRQGDVEVTIAVGIARQSVATGNGQHGHASKRLQVNGVPRRASEVVGQIAAVLFSAQDIDLLTGPPALRRRYLDVTISQVNPLYLRALQRYSRVLLQRNSLLKRLQEGLGRPDQLAFWDQELARGAALIEATRARAIAWLGARAADAHAQLSGGERLTIAYQPQLPRGLGGEALALPSAELEETLLRGLRAAQRREIEAGMSLYGPHRDDVAFAVDGAAVAAFGSRAQQRTAALALRLAETRYIEAESGDAPILLLDDILSELDEHRRRSVMETMAQTDQTLITATEADRFSLEFLAAARRYRVEGGHVTQAVGSRP